MTLNANTMYNIYDCLYAEASKNIFMEILLKVADHLENICMEINFHEQQGRRSYVIYFQIW